MARDGIGRQAELERKERYLSLYMLGYSDRFIAEKCGVDESAVSKWRRKQGYTANKFQGNGYQGGGSTTEAIAERPEHERALMRRFFSALLTAEEYRPRDLEDIADLIERFREANIEKKTA